MGYESSGKPQGQAKCRRCMPHVIFTLTSHRVFGFGGRGALRSIQIPRRLWDGKTNSHVEPFLRVTSFVIFYATTARRRQREVSNPTKHVRTSHPSGLPIPISLLPIATNPHRSKLTRAHIDPSDLLPSVLDARCEVLGRNTVCRISKIVNHIS